MGRDPLAGRNKALSVDKSDGNDAVLYVTSAALSISSARQRSAETHMTMSGQGESHAGMGCSQSSTLAWTLIGAVERKPFSAIFSSINDIAES